MTSSSVRPGVGWAPELYNNGLNRPVSKGHRLSSYARVYANYGPIIKPSSTIAVSPASMDLVNPHPGSGQSNIQISSPKRFCCSPGYNIIINIQL